MAGLASFAFTSGGLDAAVLAFSAAAVVLVALVFAAALAISLIEQQTVDRIRAQAPSVKRWAGGLLVAAGAWLLVLTIFADFFAGLFPV